MQTKKLMQMSLLTAVALIIFIVELRLPELSPVYGVKLGLSNIVTVYAVYRFKPTETAMIVLSRVLLGAVFSGNIQSLIYSFSGAVFCLSGMLLIKKIIPEKYIWLCSVIGAIFHNTGQICAALILTKTLAILSYYPLLIISGSIAGAFTGFSAQFVIKRFSGDLKNKTE